MEDSLAGTLLRRYIKQFPVEITGSILATDVDRRGKVLEVVLETDDFQQYIIERDFRGRELYNLLYSNVVVHGSLIGEDEHGKQIIKVGSYDVIYHF